MNKSKFQEPSDCLAMETLERHKGPGFQSGSFFLPSRRPFGQGRYLPLYTYKLKDFNRFAFIDSQMAHNEEESSFFERERDRLTAEITVVSRVRNGCNNASD